MHCPIPACVCAAQGDKQLPGSVLGEQVCLVDWVSDLGNVPPTRDRPHKAWTREPVVLTGHVTACSVLI